MAPPTPAPDPIPWPPQIPDEVRRTILALIDADLSEVGEGMRRGHPAAFDAVRAVRDRLLTAREWVQAHDEPGAY